MNHLKCRDRYNAQLTVHVKGEEIACAHTHTHTWALFRGAGGQEGKRWGREVEREPLPVERGVVTWHFP